MAITQTISDLGTVAKRGTVSRDEYVTARETWEDNLTQVTVGELNTAFEQINTTEENINSAEEDITTKHDIVVAKEALMNPHYDAIDEVGNNITNVNLVGTDIDNVNAVAPKIDKVETTADNISNIDTVATNITAVSNTGNNITQVVETGDNIASVVVCGDNIDDIKNASSVVTGIINDSATETSSTWSSSKIDTVLSNAGGQLATLDKSFVTNEEATLTLSQSVSSPVVGVTKEVPQLGFTNNTWDVSGSNYEFEDFALDATLTPSAVGDGTFTLGSGSFTTSNVGMRIVGNGGEAILTDTDGSYTSITPFNDTSTIASGDWSMYGLDSSVDGVEVSRVIIDGVNTEVPVMTSNTSPSGIASESSYLNNDAQYQAYKAFDDTTARWTTNNTTSGWIKYEFENTIAIGKYIITVGYGPAAPNTWTFEASNTGIFSGEEVVLDSQSGETSWSNGSSREFIFGNNTYYKYYRLNITSNDGYTYTQIQELKLIRYNSITTHNQHLPAITNTSGQIDSTYWADLNSMTATETLNNQTVNYAISTDNRTTWSVAKSGEGVRDIVRNNGGTWEYNSNVTYSLTTWTPATTNNEFQALSEAMTVSVNQMPSTQLEAVQDEEHFTLGNELDLAMILYTDNSAETPVADGVSINYDANVKNEGAILGTDYEYEHPEGDKVVIKSLADNNLKVRVV